METNSNKKINPVDYSVIYETAEVFRNLPWYSLLPCANPKHKEHVRNFLRKYTTAEGNVPKTFILVDPKD